MGVLADNVPYSFQMCSNPELSDKKEFPTFVRTFAVDTSVVPSLISLIKNTYGWKQVAVIYEDSTQWKEIKGTLLKEFKRHNITVLAEEKTVKQDLYYEKSSREEYKRAMRIVKEKARSKCFMCSAYYAVL